MLWPRRAEYREYPKRGPGNHRNCGDASGDYVTTSDGKRIVDHENIQRSRLRVDARKWTAVRLAPKKYGDHISHDVKGPGANFQPAILITVDGQPHDEFARQLAYDEDGGVLLDGN
jgi:hypothetical protein